MLVGLELITMTVIVWGLYHQELQWQHLLGDMSNFSEKFNLLHGDFLLDGGDTK